MSAGPSAPPPCAWQPLQLNHSYSRCPSLIAKAFSSYGDLPAAGAASPPALISVRGVVIVRASPAGSLNRRCSRSQPATPATANNTRASSWKRENIQHSALGGRGRQVAHRMRPAAVRARIARVEIAGDDTTGPAADARE